MAWKGVIKTRAVILCEHTQESGNKNFSVLHISPTLIYEHVNCKTGINGLPVTDIQPKGAIRVMGAMP